MLLKTPACAFVDLRPIGERTLKVSSVKGGLRLPVMDGAEATWLIRERLPEVHVVAFTSSGEPAAVAPMLAAGAAGYLLKGASSEQIAAVLESLDG
jgi:DNA-binding NarL/FixJ family response regulator